METASVTSTDVWLLQYDDRKKKKSVEAVGIEPRTPCTEHICLSTRVQSNALMRTVIAV